MHIVDTENEPSKKRHSYTFCPKCQTNTGQRIHRPALLKLLTFWLPVKRYFCYSCNKKYLV